ncbi:MAG TPA: TonB family protein [Opitutaceae bacterium]|jgi:protein TonB|nr:TonB family protein [Opitutaceae bacterium]
MNPITFDGGVKRRFVLPAAIVLSAYAALFLGFVSHPPTSHLKPTRPHETEPKPIDVSLTEETAVQDINNQTHNSSTQPQQPEVANPVLPEPLDRHPITITSEIPVVSPVTGPWSPPSGSRNQIGSGRPTLSPDMLDRAPEAVRQPHPIYPIDAKNTGKSGEVVVAFVVDESGRVLNPRVVRSTDPIFEEATLNAVKQWRFAPGTLHGVPVHFRMSVPVAFTLDG